jgi:hypothetical protein
LGKGGEFFLNNGRHHITIAKPPEATSEGFSTSMES